MVIEVWIAIRYSVRWGEAGCFVDIFRSALCMFTFHPVFILIYLWFLVSLWRTCTLPTILGIYSINLNEIEILVNPMFPYVVLWSIKWIFLIYFGELCTPRMSLQNVYMYQNGYKYISLTRYLSEWKKLCAWRTAEWRTAIESLWITEELNIQQQ